MVCFFCTECEWYDSWSFAVGPLDAGMLSYCLIRLADCELVL